MKICRQNCVTKRFDVRKTNLILNIHEREKKLNLLRQSSVSRVNGPKLIDWRIHSTYLHSLKCLKVVPILLNHAHCTYNYCTYNFVFFRSNPRTQFLVFTLFLVCMAMLIDQRLACCPLISFLSKLFVNKLNVKS